MARKDDDFLLAEEKSNTAKYLVMCAVIAILGFGGYALINYNKASYPSQPEAPIARDNGEEEKAMPPTDPTKLVEIITPTGKIVKITINFPYDSSMISESEKKRLQEFVGRVKEAKGEVKIEGYADDQGIVEYNKELSAARANETTDVLKKLGLANQVNVSAQGLGMEKPVASNDSEAGRAKNRRVEIVFTSAK